MPRHVKKGKHLRRIDAWVDTLGFYRKNVAYDETCLFRAVSEQLFSCQIHHESPKELIEYGRNNYDQFSQLMPREKFLERLCRVAVHMVVCGNFELQIISKKYKKDVLVFNGNTKQVIKITPCHYEETLRLCLRSENHYDAVYKKDYIQTTGSWQLVANSEFQDGSVQDENERFDSNNRIENKHSLDDYENMLQTNVSPFSFKVARALDENIYWNVEYNTWSEIRKGQLYYGDNNFLILGTCCILTTDEGVLQCYIQDINRAKDECVVYITGLAEKRTVRYSKLATTTDAKSWPLPYRFIKNTNTVESPSQVNAVNADRGKRTLQRRWYSKHNQRCSGRNIALILTLPVNPLRMQQPTQSYEPDTTQALADQQNVDYSVDYLVEAQDEIKPGT